MSKEHKKLIKEWRKVLAYSKLSCKEQIKRAKEFTRKGMQPTNEQNSKMVRYKVVNYDNA